MAAAYGKNLGIKQIEASNQFSAAVTEDGELFLWGNGNQADIKIKKEYQGNIEKVALTARAYVALTKDGAVVYSGFQKDNALVRIPEGLDSGVVDIAASSNAVAAVKEDGTVVVWGTCTNGENNVPAFESKPVELYGGRYHFTALMDDGEVICLPATVKDPTSVLGSASKPMRSSSSFTFRLISFQLTRLIPFESRPAKMFSAMES